MRIYIIGGPGSGKSLLADRIAAHAGVPAYHLDDIAREGGGNGPARSPEQRRLAIAEVLIRPSWVTEGIYLGWTDDLMRTAAVIVWLDYVSWPAALRRIFGRFMTNALLEARRQRGLRRFFRLGDYQRHLRELTAAVPLTWSYYRRRAEPTIERDSDVNRASTELYLARYSDKVIHCRTAGDVRALLEGYL